MGHDALRKSYVNSTVETLDSLYASAYGIGMNTTHRPTEYRPVTQPEAWTGFSSVLQSNVTIPNTIHCDRCDRDAIVEYGYVGEATFLSRYCERHDPVCGQ